MSLVFWKKKDIVLGEQKVSELTILEWKKLFSIKLFNFHKTDGDQDRFHTHAFNAVSVLLKGNYIEEIIEDRKIVQLNRSRKRFLFIPANQYHRITKSEGCRTLLITGPWGGEFKELRQIKGTLEHPSGANDWQVVVCGEHRVSLRSEGIIQLEGTK
jgi:hypothetical protein